MGCTGGTSQGMLVFQIENTGSAAWDISKVVGDPAGVHLQVPNPGTLDFGQKFSSSDVIAPGAFLLQRYAYRGATPDPTKYGTNLGSYNVDCPNNTCLQPGQLIDPGDKVWTAKVLSHGDQFTTNKDYAIDFQMLNNYNKFFGNKVTLTVTARSGGIFPSILNSYTNQCMESNESQFGVPVYPSIKDKPICNIATTSNTPATPRITPNPANPWNSK